MRKVPIYLALGVLVYGCGSDEDSGGQASGGAGGAAAAGGAGGSGTAELPAAGLRIAEISIYQGVKIQLVVGRTEMPRTAPVVAGRKALIRVFVTPDPDWQPREVIVRLTLANSAGPLPLQEIRRLVDAPSAEEPMGGAFTFDVPPEQVTLDLTYSVELLDTVPGAPGATDGTAWPAPGVTLPLDAQDSHGVLKVVLVPFQYNADGSGRMPDTSPEQIERFRNVMFGTYPVPGVEISVREPIPFSTAVT